MSHQASVKAVSVGSMEAGVKALLYLVATALFIFALPVNPVLALVLYLAALYLISGLVIVGQYERAVKFRLGKYIGILEPGVHFILPGIEKVVKVDTRISMVDIQPQEVITKDNVSVKVNGVVFFRVIDPKKAVLNIRDYVSATAAYAQTTLRDVIGGVELDELLEKREEVAGEIRKIVDEKTDEWGIDITDIKLQDIELPETMKRAMARQAEAERERRATIIKSEGEVKAAENLIKAAKILEQSKIAVHLRTLQTINDISPDPNSKIIFLLPFEVFEFLKGGEK